MLTEIYSIYRTDFMSVPISIMVMLFITIKKLTDMMHLVEQVQYKAALKFLVVGMVLTVRSYMKN